MTSSLQNGEEEYYDFKIGQLNSYDAPIDKEKGTATSYLDISILILDQIT
jgi:hypothetical protein